VIWVQGCSLGCPGCFNPETHPFDAGERITISNLVEWLCNLPPALEGVTISGGEPFQQPQGLAAFLRQVRSRTNLSILVLSGYELSEIRKIKGAAPALDDIDVLIAGRYQAGKRRASGLIGSSNKAIHFLSCRYTPDDLQSIPEAEVWIEPDGQVLLSGISPLRWQS